MPIDPRWVAAPPELSHSFSRPAPARNRSSPTGRHGHRGGQSPDGMAASATNIANTTTHGRVWPAPPTWLAERTQHGWPRAAGDALRKARPAGPSRSGRLHDGAPSVIPSLACTANRDLWGLLNCTNWFGQNTPGITRQDIEYFGHFWLQNSSVGTLYATTLARSPRQRRSRRRLCRCGGPVDHRHGRQWPVSRRRPRQPRARTPRRPRRRRPS